MRLKIKRKNMARFASLSALGAGAMVLTTGTANASIVHVVVDQTISVFGGFVSASLPFAELVLNARASTHRAYTQLGAGRWLRSYTKRGRVSFTGFGRSGFLGPYLVGGQSFHSDTFYSPSSGFQFRRSFFGTFENGGQFDFKFPDNGTPLYGWAHLSEFIDGAGELEVTFVDYAYDTVPEPAETIPLSLSALVLGAAGVRRWRASKAA